MQIFFKKLRANFLQTRVLFQILDAVVSKSILPSNLVKTYLVGPHKLYKQNENGVDIS